MPKKTPAAEQDKRDYGFLTRGRLQLSGFVRDEALAGYFGPYRG
jgi:hypothetical protein